MIHNVNTQYTAKYIANVMLTREIAKINSITLIPQMTNTDISQIAYIDIDSYCDTEEAYNFINNLKSGSLIFYHNSNQTDDDVWVFQNNTHNSGSLCVGTYTTYFTYDEEDEINTDDNNDSLETKYDEEFKLTLCQRPIQGIGIDRYTVEEAISHIDFLQEKLNASQTDFERLQIQEEIFHIDNELRIQYTMENGSNVTLRSYQNSKFQNQENQNMSNLSMLRATLFRSVSDLSV